MKKYTDRFRAILTILLIKAAMRTTLWGSTWDSLYYANLSETNYAKWAYK